MPGVTMPAPSFLRRRDAATVALSADACPRLASGVTFERAGDGGVWIASIHGVPSSRVSGAVVDLLGAMDGATALRDLYRRFDAAGSFESFLHLVQRFQATGLLGDAATPPPGRLTYRPPFTMQIATLRAPALFERLERVLIPVPPRAALAIVAVLLGAGVLAAVHQAPELRRVLTTPIPLSGLVCLVATLSLLTALHESAHGVTLTRFGGRPRRAGFMLFYLTPAFFVDVTDGWRLPDRRRRVAIALAGPAVHAVMSAIALIAALALPPSTIRQTVLLLAISCTAIVIVNLIPFVRFDGYIALMCALDEPNLRARAIRDGSAFLTRLLFGGRPTDRSLDRWWSVPFGLACLIAPVVLVVYTVSRLVRALAGGGPVVGVLVVAVEAAVVLVGVLLVARALRRIRASGVGRLRFFSVVTALVASVVVAGAMIPVPVTATFGFTTQAGRVVLLRGGEAVEATVPDGAPVVLLSNGVLANERVGVATLRPLPPQPTRVPLDALFPVTADDVSVAAVIVAEAETPAARGSLPQTGQARVELGVSNLWRALWATGAELPLSSLHSGEIGKE